MRSQYQRTEMLLGEAAMERLFKARVAVFGIGGVGGYVVEALARSGVGTLDLIDNDIVSLSNLNRQIIATHDVIGRPKVEVAKERVLSINPEAVVNAHQIFYLPDTPSSLNFKDYDYVVDAIDTVTGKIGLVMEAQKAGVPIICSMGTGNKLDPSALRVADIYQTSVCPLARVMRRELKKRGVEALKVVYSRETPVEPYSNSPAFAGMPASEKNAVPGSTAFVPAAAGLILAGQVVRDLTGV
ncbi:MAG: tRNA threonylcarbamoyladenosine dehydratase [Stomatobaculum sp.]|nr:tRNA threonylcarbamoyladenosine dehydratase [Stomatobaculum sp.]